MVLPLIDTKVLSLVLILLFTNFNLITCFLKFDDIDLTNIFVSY